MPAGRLPAGNHSEMNQRCTVASMVNWRDGLSRTNPPVCAMATANRSQTDWLRLRTIRVSDVVGGFDREASRQGIEVFLYSLPSATRERGRLPPTRQVRPVPGLVQPGRCAIQVNQGAEPGNRRIGARLPTRLWSRS